MSANDSAFGGIKLLKLLFRHKNGLLDGVRFGDRVTIISGASDTGKSTIVEAIYFLFGGKSRPTNPLLHGYQSIVLVLSSESGGVESLVRSLERAEVKLYAGDVETDGFDLPNKTLAVGKKSRNSINSYFLRLLGCSDTMLLMLKGRGMIRRPTIREILEFYVIDENRISRRSVVGRPTDQVVKNTADDRVLHFLLTGRDDRAGLADQEPLVAGSGAERERAINEMLAIAYSEVPSDLALSTAVEARDQARREMEAQYQSFIAIHHSIAEVSARVERMRASRAENELHAAELLAMHERFQLLRRQYESDLKRLEMVREGGNLMGLYSFDVCPVCGAIERDQHIGVVLGGGHDDWIESVTSEMDETVRSMVDLGATLSSLQDSIRLTEDETQRLSRLEAAALDSVAELEQSLAPIRSTFSEMMGQSGEMERHIGALNLIARLQDAKSEATEEEVGFEYENLIPDDIFELNRTMQVLIEEWGLPSPESVHFDPISHDVIYEGQTRQTHGKGIRSILYAAFTIALNDSTFRKPEAFIGFSVLDSPLVTFADPEREGSQSGDYVSDTVAQRFYASLSQNVVGQVIVIENTFPVSVDDEQVQHVRFTGSVDSGQPGLLRG